MNPDAPPPPADPPAAGPRSPWDYARACNRLALQGFGGVLAVAQHEFVERRGWLSTAEFLDLLALAQLLPGPNVINLAILLGERHFGWRGVLAALAGMLTLPLALALAVVSLAQGWLAHPGVPDALRGMGLAAAGLLLGACWKLAQPLRRSPLGAPLALGLALLAFVLVGWLRLPLKDAVLALLLVGMALAHRSLR